MGDLLSGIFDFLGGTAVAALESFVVWLYQLIVVAFLVLLQIIEAVASFLQRIVKAVGGFFDRLWNGFVKGIFASVFNAIKSGWAWIESKLAPLVRFLQRLRALLLAYFNTYIRPMLLLIQHIRQYLQLLSFLHIGFAQKLDAWLAQIQGKISQAFYTVIGTINTLTDIANALMDPTALLRKPTLLLSIRRQIPALVRVLTARPPGYFFGAPGVSNNSPFALPKFPLNLVDTTQNPPASALLGVDDGIGDTSGFINVFTFSDGAADQTQPLPIFDDSLYPPSPCTDPIQCLATVAQKASGA